MGVEYFIAKRSAERKSGGKVSIMVRVATISVALSVAMMIITLAIVFGFRTTVSQSLTGFTAEAIMSDVGSLNGSQNSPLRLNPAVEQMALQEGGATQIAPYATLQGVVRTSEAIEGVMLRGLDSLSESQFLLSTLTQGSLPDWRSATTTRDVVISASLSRRLGLTVGDRLELIVGQGDESLRRDLLKICGLYSTGLDQWDNMILLTDMRNVQRLNGWSANQISGYQLYYPSLKAAAAGCEAINNELFYGDFEGVKNLYAVASNDLYPSIFDWLKAHNVNAVVVVVIMLIVAGFNMATALLILVLERTRMIGILKSLGMNNGSLQRIFLYRAAGVTLRALLWGNGVALGLAWLQIRFDLVKLDPESYLLQSLPIDLSWWWLLLLNVGVVVAIVALMTIPSRMVSRIKVEKTLKFE